MKGPRRCLRWGCAKCMSIRAASAFLECKFVRDAFTALLLWCQHLPLTLRAAIVRFAICATGDVLFMHVQLSRFQYG
jgi:hypothetical protein